MWDTVKIGTGTFGRFEQFEQKQGESEKNKQKLIL